MDDYFQGQESWLSASAEGPFFGADREPGISRRAGDCNDWVGEPASEPLSLSDFTAALKSYYEPRIRELLYKQAHPRIFMDTRTGAYMFSPFVPPMEDSIDDEPEKSAPVVHCPRCERELAPEHCTWANASETIVNTVTSQFGTQTVREVVKGANCEYHCWWCGDKNHKQILFVPD